MHTNPGSPESSCIQGQFDHCISSEVYLHGLNLELIQQQRSAHAHQVLIVFKKHRLIVKVMVRGRYKLAKLKTDVLCDKTFIWETDNRL